MTRYLLKSEPAAWSWADQVARGAAGEAWTGVRNHQARNILRQMCVGDLALFYHSETERAAVGIVRVIRAAYPDPTDASGRWSAVDVVAVAPLPRPVTLAAVKAEAALADLPLVTRPRLSVQPVPPAAWTRILAMGGLTHPEAP